MLFIDNQINNNNNNNNNNYYYYYYYYYFIKMFKILAKTSNNLTLKCFRSTASSSLDKH